MLTLPVFYHVQRLQCADDVFLGDTCHRTMRNADVEQFNMAYMVFIQNMTIPYYIPGFNPVQLIRGLLP